MQEEVGLHAASRTASSAAARGTWTSSTRSTASRRADDKVKVSFHNEQGDIEFMAAVAARRRQGRRLARRSSATRSRSWREHVTRRLPKLTIPSPSMVHYRGGRAAIDESVYPDLDAFWADLTAAYREEVQAARRARLHVPPARRHEPRLPERPRAAPVRRLDRRRPGRAARRVHPPHQRGARRPPRRDERHDAHVPRQLPLVVGRRGRLRLRRRGALRRARRRRLLHGVGRRALRRLRAAAVPPERRQAGRARPRHDQARRRSSRRTT